ncbi:MAG: hypothetical protein K1X55_03640 [Chitinophagales bacterium]|nr:hypothetical protein [Chitinophagales bacterium]
MQNKKILNGVVSFLIGVVFIISGISKISPIEVFEISLVDNLFMSWDGARIVARLLISLELIIGFLLIFQINLRNLTYKICLGLLGFFSLFLIWMLFYKGNNTDCGCFGQWLPMTPLQSLIKNVLLLMGIYYLFKQKHGWEIPFQKIAVPVSAIALTLAVFMLNPLEFYNTTPYKEGEIGYKLPLHLVYETPNNQPPSEQLQQGKWVIAVLSSRCPHCTIAATKLAVIHKQNPDVPIFLIINGKGEVYQEFLEKTACSDVPHQNFNGKNEFVQLTGMELPAIYFVENSIVKKRPNADLLDESDIKAFLGN